jgi:hypothetical protein
MPRRAARCLYRSGCINNAADNPRPETADHEAALTVAGGATRFNDLDALVDANCRKSVRMTAGRP